ncbi:hypothetical protein B0T17DRAFT_480704, partial [Bombardia bombarda]
LPHLTATPTRHPASCASLSLPLLSLLDAVLPAPPQATLSIGSGPGLLEALLLHHHPRRAGASPASFYGVEVAGPSSPPPTQQVNRFLPEPNAVVVAGTWAVANEAAEGLLFVYPRQPGLVQAYLERGAGRVRVAVWIGPKCDLDEFTRPLRAWGVEDGGSGSADGRVVEEGEAVVVFRRRG